FLYDSSIEDRIVLGFLFALSSLVIWTHLQFFQEKINSSSKEKPFARLLVTISIVSGFVLFILLPANLTPIKSLNIGFHPSILGFAIFSQMVPFAHLKFFSSFGKNVSQSDFPATADRLLIFYGFMFFQSGLAIILSFITNSEAFYLIIGMHGMITMTSYIYISKYIVAHAYIHLDKEKSVNAFDLNEIAERINTNVFTNLKIIDQTFKKAGIDFGHLLVLLRLGISPIRLTVSQLMDDLSLTENQIRNRIEKLLVLEFVNRAPNMNDTRQKDFHIAKKGYVFLTTFVLVGNNALESMPVIDVPEGQIISLFEESEKLLP
ncbi:MAG: hypothetical protein KAR35_06420, partial [Candidatus Heimdallarchaeota archaeon]|nr:hypothetical protein [Candidatus Heimdallarchaeota archaeon]MCK5048992.1 hypothetical protein [Candidatus Heimdallarchaeota archaeon]